jgi:hypothetical protein
MSSTGWHNAGMTRPPLRKRGRPRSNPLPRAEQLRLAKRAQRARERAAGKVQCQVRLGAPTAERLRRALAVPGFEAELAGFLGDALVDVREHPELALLCWNRSDRFIPAREAFALYERNWRFVDARRLKPRERALIERLARRFGNGVLNA